MNKRCRSSTLHPFSIYTAGNLSYTVAILNGIFSTPLCPEQLVNCMSLAHKLHVLFLAPSCVQGCKSRPRIAASQTQVQNSAKGKNVAALIQNHLSLTVMEPSPASIRPSIVSCCSCLPIFCVFGLFTAEHVQRQNCYKNRNNSLSPRMLNRPSDLIIAA